MKKLQFDNIIDIINGPIYSIEDMNEIAIMTSMLQNNGSSFIFKNNPKDEYEGLRFYDKKYNVVTQSDNYIDIDIFPSIYSEKCIKYLFLLDILHQFYSSLKNYNKIITVKSRYIIDNGKWKHYSSLDSTKYFTFDIQFERHNPEYYKIANISSDSIEINIVADMCLFFREDIVRHIGYIYNVDVVEGGNDYLDNIAYLYKLCRLKIIHHIIGDNEAISKCLKNITNNLSNTSQIVDLHKESIKMLDNIEKNDIHIDITSEKIRKTEEKISINYKQRFVLIFFIVSFVIILLNWRQDMLFLSMTGIVLSIIYIYLRGQVLIHEYFGEKSYINREFDVVRDKIYNNIVDICKSIINDRVYESIKNKHISSNKIRNASDIKLYESRSFLNERKMYNQFVLKTLDFIYRIFFVTVIIIMLSAYINKVLLPIFYIVIYVIYVIDVVKIVRTNYQNVYWKPPKSFNLID